MISYKEYSRVKKLNKLGFEVDNLVYEKLLELSKSYKILCRVRKNPKRNPKRKSNKVFYIVIVNIVSFKYLPEANRYNRVTDKVYSPVLKQNFDYWYRKEFGEYENNMTLSYIQHKFSLLDQYLENDLGLGEFRNYNLDSRSFERYKQ